MSQLALIATSPALPALIADASDPAALCYLQFFVAPIRNPDTWRAYSRDEAEFLLWCKDQGGTRKRCLAADGTAREIARSYNVSVSTISRLTI